MAAPWKSKVTVPATFRGVEFHIDVAEYAGGRKNVVFDYPLRDTPFVEDLGRLARTFPIEAYVIGDIAITDDDYLAKRDALVDALEQEGPGTLVHPYHGTRTVALLGPFRVVESRDEGGWARFSLVFIETETQPFAPGIAAAPGAQLAASTPKALVAMNGALLNGYKTTLPSLQTAPAFSFNSIAQLVTDYTTKLRNVLSPIIKDTQALAAFKLAADGILANVNTLVRTPTTLAAQFGYVLRSLLQWAPTPRLGLQAVLDAFDFSTIAVRPTSPSTPSRRLEQTNYDAIDFYLRTSTLVQAAQFAGDAADASTPSARIGITPTTAETSDQVADPTPVGFDSYDEAVSFREQLFDAIDAQAAAAPDDVYTALMDVRAQLAAAVPGVAADLPRLVHVTPAITVPALVLAYRLYGDVDLVDDLVARNRVARPGFVPGGRQLQVLSHA